MKPRNKTLIAACLAMSFTPAMAAHGGAGLAWAKVVDAQPVYEIVRQPVREERCWDEEVWHREPSRPSATSVIVGSIIGGVIGNQFGGGSGNTALTAAGAVLGGSIAADASRRRNPEGYYAVTETQCAVETNWRTEERIVAWDVRYKYRGDIYETRMKQRPGKRIQVRVDVQPLGY